MGTNILNNAVQTAVSTKRKRGKAGQLAHTSGKRNAIATYINAEPQSRWTRNLTVATYTDGAEYRFVIGAAVIVYVAITADVDAAGVAAKLKTAIESNPVAGGYVTVSRSGAVLTLTGRWSGFDYPMSTADAKLTLGAETASLLAGAVKFGRVLFKGGTPRSAGNRLAHIPLLADIVLDKYVLTPAVANSTPYPVTLISPSGAVLVPSATSDGSATAQEIVEAVKAQVDLQTAFVNAGGSASEDNAALTINLPRGWRLQATAVWSVAFTAGTNADDKLAGVALFTQAACADPFDGGDTNGYIPNSAMDVLEADGAVWVECLQSVTPADPVYIETSGADAGRVYKDSSATRILSKRLRWSESSDGADGIAMLDVLQFVPAA